MDEEGVPKSSKAKAKPTEVPHITRVRTVRRMNECDDGNDDDAGNDNGCDDDDDLDKDNGTCDNCRDGSSGTDDCWADISLWGI